MSGRWKSEKELRSGMVALFELISVQVNTIETQVFGWISHLKDAELLIGLTESWMGCWSFGRNGRWLIAGNGGRTRYGRGVARMGASGRRG